MRRRVFYSFHYKKDNWRASKVRNIGAIEDNRPASDNDWESIASTGDHAIESWIRDQMDGRTCTIVLIGSETAGRKWISHEIKESWNRGLGVLGIYIHNLTSWDNQSSTKGHNPFEHVSIGQVKLSSIVKTYDPPFATSQYVRNYIADNLAKWIEEAIEIRKSR